MFAKPVSRLELNIPAIRILCTAIKIERTEVVTWSRCLALVRYLWLSRKSTRFAIATQIVTIIGTKRIKTGRSCTGNSGGKRSKH